MKILLSIKPQFANKIFSGEKKFEYRKKIPNTVTEVVVYSSAPNQKVIGSFSVKRILELPLADLWKETKNDSGITKSFFDSYYKDKNRGVALEIAEPNKFKKEKTLSEININTAPQSYLYLK